MKGACTDFSPPRHHRWDPTKFLQGSRVPSTLDETHRDPEGRWIMILDAIKVVHHVCLLLRLNGPRHDVSHR